MHVQEGLRECGKATGIVYSDLLYRSEFWGGLFGESARARTNVKRELMVCYYRDGKTIVTAGDDNACRIFKV